MAESRASHVAWPNEPSSVYDVRATCLAAFLVIKISVKIYYRFDLAMRSLFESILLHIWFSLLTQASVFVSCHVNGKLFQAFALTI